MSPELIPDRCQSFRTAADGPSVQLRLRLRLVPVRPSGDVLELRLEEIVQELLLRVLHLREDLASIEDNGKYITRKRRQHGTFGGNILYSPDPVRLGGRGNARAV